MSRPPCRPIVSGLISGFLPGLVLKAFLYFLPAILKAMSTFEGYNSNSRIIKETCIKMYYFQLVREPRVQLCRV
jgi:hypothetical protein